MKVAHLVFPVSMDCLRHRRSWLGVVWLGGV